MLPVPEPLINSFREEVMKRRMKRQDGTLATNADLINDVAVGKSHAMYAFDGQYRKALVAFIRAKLRNFPVSIRENAEDYVQKFLAKAYVSRTVFVKYCRESGSFRDYLYRACWWTAVSELRKDLPRGSVERYQRYRPGLIEYIQTLLARDMPDAASPELAAEYADEFVEYYASWYGPPPSRPAPERQERFLAELQAACLDFVEYLRCDPDGRTHRRKRPTVEQCNDWGLVEDHLARTAGRRHRERQPYALPELIWAVEVQFEAMILWWNKHRDPERRRWKLLELRVLEPLVNGVPPPTWESIYAACGYDRRHQADNAFGNVQEQIARCQTEVIRGGLAASGLSPDDAEECLAERLEDFANILSRVARPVDDAAPLASLTPDQGAVRQYVTRRLGAIWDRVGQPIPGISLMTDAEPRKELPELKEGDLYYIAKMFAQVFRRKGGTQTEDELRDQWTDYLARPLSDVLEDCSPERRRDLKGLAEEAALTDGSIGQMLHHTAPPLEWLKAIKSFVKRRRTYADEDTASEVLQAVYELCVAASLVTAGRSNSKKTETELAEDLQWLVQLPWIDERSREMGNDALTQFRKLQSPNRHS